MRYQEDLNRQRNSRRIDESERKRKLEKTDVEKLKEKKRRQEIEISDLMGCAYEFVKKLRRRSGFPISKSNSLRDGSAKKKGEVY